MNRFKKQKDRFKDIAKERIEKLFRMAAEKKDYANRYVALARKISMKHKVRIPPALKRRFCKHCGSYFSEGNLRVRTVNKKVVYTCLSCGERMRVPFLKERKAKKV